MPNRVTFWKSPPTCHISGIAALILASWMAVDGACWHTLCVPSIHGTEPETFACPDELIDEEE